MITTIVTELEAFKAKVQEAIDLAKSGVNHLNEDQQAALYGLVTGIESEATNVRQRIEIASSGVEAKAETFIDRVEAEVKSVVQKVEEKLGLKEAQPSAADLDAHADEQKAAEATEAK